MLFPLQIPQRESDRKWHPNKTRLEESPLSSWFGTVQNARIAPLLFWRVVGPSTANTTKLGYTGAISGNLPGWCPEAKVWGAGMMAISSFRPHWPRLSMVIPIPSKSQGLPRSPKVSQGLPRSPKVSQGIPRSPKVSQGLPRYPRSMETVLGYVWKLFFLVFLPPIIAIGCRDNDGHLQIPPGRCTPPAPARIGPEQLQPWKSWKMHFWNVPFFHAKKTSIENSMDTTGKLE